MVKTMKNIFYAFIFISQLAFSQSGIQIGDYYQGGVVFYTEADGKGLIVDTDYLEATTLWLEGQPLQSKWGHHWVNNPNTIEAFIGGGQHNTANLIESNTNDFAANVCSNSNASGFSDWFLPSKDELWQMMTFKSVIDSAINTYGGDSIYDSFHWSSTQASPTNAWAAIATSTTLEGQPAGPVELSWSKSNTALVRAVRCINNDCSFASAPEFGCIDPVAENYNPNAGASDFSCEYIEGCTDETSCNYDSLATMSNPLLCDYNCYGCTDSTAMNYTELEVTIDDDSCLYCEDSYQTITVTYDSIIDNALLFMIDNGEIAFGSVSGSPYEEGYCMSDGCYNLYLLANCDISNNWVGNTISIGDFSYTLDSVQASIDFSIGVDSCIYGCTNPGFLEFNLMATIDDSTCSTIVIGGCTDSLSCNWNYEANIDDESCTYPELYLDCAGECLNDIDLDGVCDEQDYDDDLGVSELIEKTPQLIKMVDILGREHMEHKKGLLLFYIYDNGLPQKKVR